MGSLKVGSNLSSSGEKFIGRVVVGTCVPLLVTACRPGEAKFIAGAAVAWAAGVVALMDVPGTGAVT